MKRLASVVLVLAAFTAHAAEPELTPGTEATFALGVGRTIAGTKVIVTYVQFIQADSGIVFHPQKPRFTVTGCTPRKDCPWVVLDAPTPTETEAKATVVPLKQLDTLHKECLGGAEPACESLWRLTASDQLSVQTSKRLIKRPQRPRR